MLSDASDVYRAVPPYSSYPWSCSRWTTGDFLLISVFSVFAAVSAEGSVASCALPSVTFLPCTFSEEQRTR